MKILDIFKRKDNSYPLLPLVTDIHSHLLPNLDDGSKGIEETIAMLSYFKTLGYSKVITTPHVMQDYYPNTSSGIIERLQWVREEIKLHQLDIQIEAAAEYFLDEFLMEKLTGGTEDLLTFGKTYLLFEMSFMQESPFLKEFIFSLKTKGITPVLAHPERYNYLHGKPEFFEDLVERGCLLQLNINSLSGHYSKPVQKMAEQLIDQKLIHFLGSDAHHLDHLHKVEESRRSKYYRKALNLPLLNGTI